MVDHVLHLASIFGHDEPFAPSVIIQAWYVHLLLLLNVGSVIYSHIVMTRGVHQILGYAVYMSTIWVDDSKAN